MNKTSSDNTSTTLPTLTLHVGASDGEDDRLGAAAAGDPLDTLPTTTNPVLTRLQTPLNTPEVSRPVVARAPVTSARPPSAPQPPLRPPRPPQTHQPWAMAPP